MKVHSERGREALYLHENSLTYVKKKQGKTTNLNTHVGMYMCVYAN